jgi:hypothetical protein
MIQYQRTYLRIREWISDTEWRHVWVENRNGKEHYFEQHFSKNTAKPPKRIRDKKEIADLVWWAQRYYPNGDRI